ncbi:MAG: glycosyltransferase, partial [Nitrospirae bacterium]|nr:glycosyltransferase [Nitrospirota bacterium]
MNKRISVIIPNYNGSSTIGRCLEAAFSSEYDNFEVIVTDDCSTDNSIEIIKEFPCKFISLDKHSGASKARNTGAENSSGKILFFIDADCLLQKNTLASVNKAFLISENAIIGGTYTAIPYDKDFFSTFQSIFINYSETKKEPPDYIPTHAMVIARDIFMKSGGFKENFLPILEDVEFSHRLRKMGYKLTMNSEILVRHIFDFTLIKSMKNAFRKSLYWTIYSLKNKDLLADSGTASYELKINVATLFLNALLSMLFFYFKNTAFLISIFLICAVNLSVSKGLIKAFYKAKGLSFVIATTLYYTLIYPLPVGAGAFSGILKYIRD